MGRDKRQSKIGMLEDEEDIREGLKALCDERDTVTWEEYQEERVNVNLSLNPGAMKNRGERI